MKRTPLQRRTPLKSSGKPLKRSEMKRGGGLKRTPFKRQVETLQEILDEVTRKWSRIPKVNHARAKKRRERDFGPHGDWIVPALPCAVGYKEWWSKVSDETICAMMEAALWDRGRYEMVSEPAHTKSRGAGGRRWDLVPLSPLLHSEQHTIGVESFAAKYGVDLPALAARLARLSPARMLEEEST